MSHADVTFGPSTLGSSEEHTADMDNTNYPTASEYLDNDSAPSTWLDVVMAHYDATIVIGRGPAGYINATLTVNLPQDRCLTVSRRGATALHAADRLCMALMNHPLFDLIRSEHRS